MEDKKKLKLQVSAIENGTVIDHIPADKLFEVITILGLDKTENQITFGSNLESKKLNKKSIIKVADKFFEEDEINKIALLAPNAKLNIIRDYSVVEKSVVKLPENIIGIVKCVNPKCITHVEHMPTSFKVVKKEHPITLQCKYCEKHTVAGQIQTY